MCTLYLEPNYVVVLRGVPADTLQADDPGLLGGPLPDGPQDGRALAHHLLPRHHLPRQLLPRQPHPRHCGHEL